MSIPRPGHTETLLSNGEVLVAGGFTAGTTVAAHLASITASAELYTPRAARLEGIGASGPCWFCCRLESIRHSCGKRAKGPEAARLIAWRNPN